MGTVSTTLPSDGQTIDAADVNTPINAILAEFNGNIDDNNIKTGANINGSKLLAGSIPGSKLDSTTYGGWIAGVLPAVSSVTYNGNRSYDVTFGSTVASYLTPGMRVRTSRTVAAPTQCTDLESGSSQYYSKTSPSGMTFTDDFVVSAWVKLESYTQGAIASRYNGTSGWTLRVESDGTVMLLGYNAGAANFSRVTSYQSVPLGKWVHVAAQLDMSTFTATSTTSYIMIDGVDVPAAVSRGGTNPTVLIQAGNLEIGATNAGTLPFDGKIAQVAIYSAKVTQANIRATISQGLSGSETSLISAYSFNNSINDLNTSNANNLTANGSAVATNADSPFTVDANGVAAGTYDWGIVTKVSTTTATIQVPEGCAIPTSGGVSAVDLCTSGVPFGMPCLTPLRAIKTSSSTTTSATPVQADGLSVTITPIAGRELKITLNADGLSNSTGVTNSDASIHIGTVGTSTQLASNRVTSGGANYKAPVNVVAYYTPTSSSAITFNAGVTNVGGGTASLSSTGVTSPATLTVEYSTPL